MTGVLVDVVVHASEPLCPSSSRAALIAHGHAPCGRRYPPDGAAHAAPSLRCADAHGPGSRFQLHRRPAASAASFKSRYRKCLGPAPTRTPDHLRPRHFRWTL